MLFFLPLFPKLLDRLWGPPSLLFSGYSGSFPGLKRPGRKVDRSAPSTAEVKNEWRYTSTPPACVNCVDRNLFFLFMFLIGGNGVSPVDIVTGQRGGLSIPSRREKYLCSVKRVDRSCGRSGVCSVSGTQRREVDQSPCSAELLENICGDLHSLELT